MIKIEISNILSINILPMVASLKSLIMKKIVLPENHKRTLAFSLTLIENLVDELEIELLNSKEKITTKIIANKEEKIDLQHYEIVIQEIKKYIRNMAAKYNLGPFNFSLSQIINSRKSEKCVKSCVILNRKK
jgi:hypothetical protein